MDVLMDFHAHGQKLNWNLMETGLHGLSTQIREWAKILRNQSRQNTRAAA